MKCTHCRNEFYPTVYDIGIDHGVKHHIYICPWCEEEVTYPIKHKSYFNKEKFKNFISEVVVIIVIFISTYYIFSHSEKFFTTFRK